jgi:4-hydroxyphenylpyruvate dioxygenase-like putative hemolysin
MIQRRSNPLVISSGQSLESTTAGGVMRKFIEKKGEGIHPVSFEVDDIEAELAELKVRGVHVTLSHIIKTRVRQRASR